jgi:hypothetical protein
MPQRVRRNKVKRRSILSKPCAAYCSLYRILPLCYEYIKHGLNLALRLPEKDYFDGILLEGGLQKYDPIFSAIQGPPETPGTWWWEDHGCNRW